MGWSRATGSPIWPTPVTELAEWPVLYHAPKSAKMCSCGDGIIRCRITCSSPIGEPRVCGSLLARGMNCPAAWGCPPRRRRTAPPAALHLRPQACFWNGFRCPTALGPTPSLGQCCFRWAVGIAQSGSAANAEYLRHGALPLLCSLQPAQRIYVISTHLSRVVGN